MFDRQGMHWNTQVVYQIWYSIEINRTIWNGLSWSIQIPLSIERHLALIHSGLHRPPLSSPLQDAAAMMKHTTVLPHGHGCGNFVCQVQKHAILIPEKLT